MKNRKSLIQSPLFMTLTFLGLQAGNTTSAYAMDTLPLPKEKTIINEKQAEVLAPVHKAYLCLIKEKGEKGKPEIALLNKGEYLDFPNYVLSPSESLKQGVCSSLKTTLNINVKDYEVHPFAHFEYILENQKIIHDYMIILVDSSLQHKSLLFQEIGNGAIFYQKSNSNSFSKPLKNFHRLHGIQSILYAGFRGDVACDYYRNLFKTVLTSYGHQDSGYLTITPDLFEKYSKLRVNREIHHDCVIF